jgi:hypothetical protein
LKMVTYLISEPDVVWTFRLLNLLGGAIFLVLEQEDDSMNWFGQNGKSVIVDTKDFMNSEITNTDVFENSCKEGLRTCKFDEEIHSAR